MNGRYGLLWCAGCGALPVVDANGKVVGMITDRDVCIALGTRGQRAADLVVAQVMSGQVFACRPTDDIHAALKTMRTQKVRRLPVINHEGKLEGLVTISDMILQAFHDDGRAKRPDLSYEDVMATLIGIHLRTLTATAKGGQAQHVENSIAAYPAAQCDTAKIRLDPAEAARLLEAELAA